MIKFVFVLTFVFISAISSIDYCSFCEDSTHIACKNDGKFGPKCPANAKIIKFDQKLKDLAIEHHNIYRNQIAIGNVTKYPKAARMATLVWDDNLAYFAELNVRRCIFEHDQCRNTAVFKYAGQNLGMKAMTKSYPTAEDIVKQISKGWFDEYKNGNVAIINKFGSVKTGMVGHFTQVVRDQAYAVGCAMVQFQKSGSKWFETIYACDYTLTNISDNPIYHKSSKTGSACTTGMNKQYPGLCSTKEKYDNDLFYAK